MDTMGGSVTSWERVVWAGPTELMLGRRGVEGEACTGTSRAATVSSNWEEGMEGGREGGRKGGL